MHSVFLHCSGSDADRHDDVSVIRRWHFANGWDDVGYHFFIRRSGEVQPGRSLEKTPAAQRGHNKGTIAICLHGGRLERFSTAQFDSLSALCLAIAEAYEPGELRFRGHCEVSRKACPVFDYSAVLGLSAEGRLLPAAYRLDTAGGWIPVSARLAQRVNTGELATFNLRFALDRRFREQLPACSCR